MIQAARQGGAFKPSIRRLAAHRWNRHLRAPLEPQSSLRPLSSLAQGVFERLRLPTTPEPLAGAFSGTWHSSGPILESRDPATNELLAQVKRVCVPERGDADTRQR